METEKPELRWGVERRLEFLEFRLFWEGGANRSDITDYFGVSVPQASKDLSLYQELAPDNIRYDRSVKRYFATERFAPRFLNPDSDRYLLYLRSIADGVLASDETWLAQAPSFEALPMPRRHTDPGILRTVLATIRQESALEIRYQSLSRTRPKPVWRWITPHALGFDGHRWHVRSFCHIDRRVKDFLLPRILKTRDEGEAQANPEEDLVWQEFTTVTLKPHPGLNEDQQDVVARDYGMRNRQVSVELRLALLYYFLKRLGLDFNEQSREAREQHVVLANPDSVRAALDRAQYRIAA